VKYLKITKNKRFGKSPISYVWDLLPLSGDLDYIDIAIIEHVKDGVQALEPLNPRILGPFLPTGWENSL